MNQECTEDRGVLPDEIPVGVTLTRTCVGCGTEYEWTSREGWQWPTSYCTRSCKRKCSPKRRTKLDSAADGLTTSMVLLLCGRCEDPFGWTPRPDADGTLQPPSYCSAACQRAMAAKRRKERDRAKQQKRENKEWRQDDERIAAMAAAARELLLPASHCITCGKVASPTKEAAKEAKRAIEQRAGRTNEVRYYQCNDGWWHWTRMNTWGAQPEHLMTESPASLRHRGRGAWRSVGEAR